MNLQLPVRFGWARNPVLAISAVWGGVYCVYASRRAYTPFNELYFLSAGKFHLDWSYADQPIGLPLLARVADAIWPASTLGLRLPAIALCVIGIIAASLLVREFGGGTRAQVATAAMYGGLGITPGWVELETTSVDPQLWLIITYLVVRWMRTESARYLLAAGLVTGLALSVKYLVPILWVGIVIGVMTCGPRRLLTRPAFWLSGGLAVVLALPGVLWQHAHGWPQAAMTEHLSTQNQIGGFAAGMLLVLVPFGAIGLVGAIVGVSRIPELKAFRFLVVALAVAAAAVFASGGRPDYVDGLLAAVIICGIAAADRALPDRLLRWGAGPLAAVTVAIPLVLAGTQIAPKAGAVPTMVARVTAIAGQNPGAPIVSDSYELAAKVEYLGSMNGSINAPGRVFSPHLGYWYFGAPPDTDTILYVARTEDLPDPLRRAFQTATQVTKIDGDVSVGPVYVWRLSERTEAWNTLWPQLNALK